MNNIKFYSEGRKMYRTNIEAVANFFLSLGDETMTHKKLQKLCYYAYSWGKVLLNQSIFRNNFQAWIHGPVDPDLYNRYKHFRWHPIPHEENQELHDDEIMQLLHEVYESYGHLSGDELEALTHHELPWIEAREGIPAYMPSNNQLSDETIYQYYSKLLKDNQGD